jgi:hypothetical protein
MAETKIPFKLFKKEKFCEFPRNFTKFDVCQRFIHCERTVSPTFRSADITKKVYLCLNPSYRTYI